MPNPVGSSVLKPARPSGNLVSCFASWIPAVRCIANCCAVAGMNPQGVLPLLPCRQLAPQRYCEIPAVRRIGNCCAVSGMNPP